MQPLPRAIISALGVILLFVALQAVLPNTYEPKPRELKEEGACRGEPISVDVAYDGGVHDPWTCQIQCADGKPRYILYANGKATQCETPPGCNDWGEDRGITCVPQAASVTS